MINTEPGDIIVVSPHKPAPTYCTRDPMDQIYLTGDGACLDWCFRNPRDAVHGALNLTEPEP